MKKAAMTIAVLALAGCANIGQVDLTSTRGSYGRLDWGAVTLTRTLPLSIKGNPTALPPDLFKVFVMKDIERRVRFDGVAVHPWDPASGDTGYRLAMAFGPAEPGAMFDPCGSADPGAASHDPVVLFAAVCEDGDALQIARAQTPASKDDGTGAVRRAIGGAMSTLTVYHPPPAGGG